MPAKLTTVRQANMVYVVIFQNGLQNYCFFLTYANKYALLCQ